jgi:DNA-binding transcriptional regulator of glucitol operon
MGGFLDYVITCFVITKLCLWEQWTYFQDNFGLQTQVQGAVIQSHSTST